MNEKKTVAQILIQHARSAAADTSVSRTNADAVAHGAVGVSAEAGEERIVEPSLQQDTNTGFPEANPQKTDGGPQAVEEHGEALEQPGTYQVVWGDKLWRIAECFYGDRDLYEELATQNRLEDQECLIAGEALILPESVESRSVRASNGGNS